MIKNGILFRKLIAYVHSLACGALNSERFAFEIHWSHDVYFLWLFISTESQQFVYLFLSFGHLPDTSNARLFKSTTSGKMCHVILSYRGACTPQHQMLQWNLICSLHSCRSDANEALNENENKKNEKRNYRKKWNHLNSMKYTHINAQIRLQ